MSVELVSERAVCPKCGVVKTRTTDRQGVPDEDRWDVKTRSRHGRVWWHSSCWSCHRALRSEAEKARRIKRRVGL